MTTIQTPLETLRHNWGWFIALGVGLVLLGFIALGEAVAVTVGAMWFFGVLLILGGIAHAVQARTARLWAGVMLGALLGVLYVIAGIGAIIHPIQTAVFLTLFLGISFLLNGVARMVLSFMHRSSRSCLVIFLSGLISCLLGGSILARWPESSLYILGLFIGIELIFDGVAWITLGLAGREVAARHAPPTA